MKTTKLTVTVALLMALAAGGILYTQASDAADEKTPVTASPGNGKPPALTASKAKLYNDTMRKAAEENKKLQEQIKQVRDQADAILVAPNFDQKAYLAKAEEMDKLIARARTNMNEAFASVASQFSAEERKALLDSREARQQRLQQARQQAQQKAQQKPQ